MELQIAVEELSRALYRAQGIVEKKSSQPMLSNVLLEASTEGLTLKAFDLEIGLISEHRAEVQSPGRLTIAARRLYDIVKVLPEPMVTIRQGQNHFVEIACGASHFRIVGSPADDFPSLPVLAEVPFVKVNSKQLLEMIELTSFAVSTDETRFNLNGIFFEPVEGGLRIVATDGHRLALVERKMEGDFKLPRGVIIPRKGMQELRRLLSEGGDDAELGFVGNSGVLRKPGLTMVMQLVNGQFPEYERVIPKESTKSVKVARARFLETLRRVSLLSPEQAKTVTLEVGEAAMRVSCQNPDLGEAHEELSIDGGGNEALKIGFNSRYLIDVLSASSCEEISIELSDDLSPGVIHPAGDKSYTAVVMPVRI